MAYPQDTMTPVIHADEQTRSAFLIRVYQHLALAVVAFIAFESALFVTGIAEGLYNFLAGSGIAWLLILGGFMVVNAIASRAAHNIQNIGAQYAGLFGLALAEAVIFAPFLHYAFNVADGGTAAVGYAVVVTAIGFAALTLVAFTTRRDLSFLRPVLTWGFIVAIGLIVASLLFGFQLGIIFTIAMIGLAGASILYQTQQIIRQYPAWAHVGAAVGLFASVMLLFWYVLQFFIGRD
ncbi:MAG: Bax inhibitor-1 family protein [Actinomycetota bacterium]